MSDSDLNFFSTNEPNTSSDNSATQAFSSESGFYTKEATQPTNNFNTFYENTTIIQLCASCCR